MRGKFRMDIVHLIYHMLNIVSSLVLMLSLVTQAANAVNPPQPAENVHVVVVAWGGHKCQALITDELNKPVHDSYSSGFCFIFPGEMMPGGYDCYCRFKYAYDKQPESIWTP